MERQSCPAPAQQRASTPLRAPRAQHPMPGVHLQQTPTVFPFLFCSGGCSSSRQGRGAPRSCPRARLLLQPHLQPAGMLVPPHTLCFPSDPSTGINCPALGWEGMFCIPSLGGSVLAIPCRVPAGTVARGGEHSHGHWPPSPDRWHRSCLCLPLALHGAARKIYFILFYLTLYFLFKGFCCGYPCCSSGDWVLGLRHTRPEEPPKSVLGALSWLLPVDQTSQAVGTLLAPPCWGAGAPV